MRNVPRLSFFYRFLTLPAIMLGVFLFQNCSSFSGQSSSPNSSTVNTNQNGNGTGYGGMTVINFVPAGTVCPDLTTINQRVQIVNSIATLVRNKCQDLPPTQTQVLGPVAMIGDPAQVTVNGSQYQLESLLDNSKGEVVQNLAGNYAPAMATSTLPSASFVDGVALGANYILVAFSQQPALANVTGSQITLRLYQRTEVSLTLLQELAVPVTTAMGIDDFQVLLGAFAFDDAHAVIFVRQATPYVALALLVEKSGNSISVIDSNASLGNVIQLSGHPLNSTDYLLSYLPNGVGPLDKISLQVVSIQNGKLHFGGALTLTNPAPSPSGPVSLLAEATAGGFDAYMANTNYNYLTDNSATGLGNLVHFTVQVRGTTVGGGTNIALMGSTTDLLAGALDFVGNSAAALLNFKTPNSGFAWMNFSAGLYQPPSLIPSTAGNYTGNMNMMGTENLNYGGRYYFRLPTDTGTRIYYLESLTGTPKLYNTAFARSVDFNMSKLFISGDNLISIESNNSIASWSLNTPMDGHVRVLSTPP